MVNLDMVGRLRGNTLIALGLESAPEWAALLRDAAIDTKLDVAARGDGYGPSDQTSFYAKGIPVIHLFTGTHEQYHTPDDKPATINSEGGGLVARFTQVLVERSATRDRRLTYARSNTAPTMTGDSRGYGAYLGTVPDFKAMDAASGGVLLSDVRAGGPAEIAGIKGGDRVVSIAGTRIENLYDMSYALQDHRPGQTVEVTVVRAEDTLTFRARPERPWRKRRRTRRRTIRCTWGMPALRTAGRCRWPRWDRPPRPARRRRIRTRGWRAWGIRARPGRRSAPRPWIRSISGGPATTSW